MKIHFDKLWKFILISLQWRYAISSYPLSKLDRIWRPMGILTVCYNGVSKQHKGLNISEIAWTIFVFSFQFWSLLKFGKIQNRVQKMHKWCILIIWEAKVLVLEQQHSLRATTEAKFQNLLFLPYNFHFLKHRDNYDARIHTWGREVS